jgi:hypothetical protein
MPISTVNQNGLNAPLTLTSPVLTTPNLGTPSALVLTNATGLPASALPASGVSASSLTTGTLPTARLPAGCMLQVVSTNYGTRTVISQTTSVIDMPGMTVNITPTSATSKILVLINLAFNAPDGQNIMGFLNRNGTLIGQSTSSGAIQSFFGMATANDGNYRMWSASANYLDSPATTSTLTYKLQSRCAANTSTWYLNGTGRNSSDDALGSSTITVMEIAG